MVGSFQRLWRLDQRRCPAKRDARAGQVQKAISWSARSGVQLVEAGRTCEAGAEGDLVECEKRSPVQLVEAGRTCEAGAGSYLLECEKWSPACRSGMHVRGRCRELSRRGVRARSVIQLVEIRWRAEDGLWSGCWGETTQLLID